MLAAAATVAALSGAIAGPAAPASAAWAPQIERLSGADRYQTAVAISKKFPAGPTHVFIATGEAFPDALSVSALASSYESPLLLVQKNSIPAGVVNEIKRLKPREILIAGGTGAVSKNVENQLSKLVGELNRASGADRYDTSLAIAQFGPWYNGATFVATGRDFPDALTAAPVAGDFGAPVLLVDGKRSSLDSATKNAIVANGPKFAAVIGGTGAVSAGIFKQLGGLHATMYRFNGSDRYETGVKLNDQHFGSDYDVAYLAVGTGYADALAGGSLAAQNGPLFLVQRNCIPSVVLDSLNKAQPAKVVLLGGKGVLTDGVAKLKRCA